LFGFVQLVLEKTTVVLFWFLQADNSKVSAARLWDQSPIPRHIRAGALAAASAGIMDFRRLKDRFLKNRPLDEEEAGHLTN
jgi:hypothetical protein